MNNKMNFIEAEKIIEKYQAHTITTVAEETLFRQAISYILDELKKYRHSAFITGETLVDESKHHITPNYALEKIRKNLYYHY